MKTQYHFRGPRAGAVRYSVGCADCIGGSIVMVVAAMDLFPGGVIRPEVLADNRSFVSCGLLDKVRESFRVGARNRQLHIRFARGELRSRSMKMA